MAARNIENIEEENFIRMTLLINGVCHHAVRNYFDLQFPPASLSVELHVRTNLDKLRDLKLKKVINMSQWDLLFPNSGSPDSKTFDLTLMICLIRNLTSIARPSQGFDAEPLETEIFPGADLARIKYYRNHMSHLGGSQIDTPSFETYWKEVADAVVRLGGPSMQQLCQYLRTKILDQSNQEIVLKLDEMSSKLAKLMNARDATVPWNVKCQVIQTLERWKSDDQIFVETRASKHILRCVEANSCVTVTGSSGTGKTATVRHVALKMEKSGYDLIPVTDPSDIVKYYNPNQCTLFVVDDFCGTYSLNPAELQKWKTLNKDLEIKLNEKKIKIILTCRLQIYHDEKFIPLFQSCECNLLSDSICLLPDEKMSIATAYLKTDAPKIEQYAESYDFFPLLCRLYKENSDMNISNFFTNPFSMYKGEIDKLYKEGAYGKYCALALCVMFDNTLLADWFTEGVPKEIRPILEETLDACRMNRGTSRVVLKDELDTLVHTFLKIEDGVYKTIHDKLFDFIVFYFGNKMLPVLIINATSRFIRERFIFGIISNNDQYKIFIPDKYKMMYIKRLFNDWEHGEVVDVFFNINMKLSDFRRQLKNCLKSLSTSFQKRLACKCDISNSNTVLIQCCYIRDTELIQWCFSHGVDVNQGGDEGASPLFVACQEGYREIVKMLLEMEADIEKCTNAGASPLFIACERGHCEIVTMLLQINVDIDKCMNDGATPLFIACRNEHMEIVKMLLEKEVEIDKCLNDRESPLFTVCEKGNIKIVKILLENNADINLCMENGASPCFIACQNGHQEIVNLLLENTADINKCIDSGESPLFVACQNGHTKIVNMLLDKKPDINKCTVDGASPLARACQNGHLDIVKILLEKKADPNKCMNNGASPLCIACMQGHREIVNMLLDKQADIDKCTKTGASPLFQSCQNGYKEIVHELLDRKANINNCTWFGVSPLLVACHQGHSEIVNLLLDKRANITKCADDGQSPLSVACKNGYSEIVKALLDKGVDVNQCNSDGVSALFNACQNGHGEIVNILLQTNADIEICMNDGASPLIVACQNGHFEVVNILLKRKVDIHKCMSDGRSPIFIACENGRREIFDILLENGADINKDMNNEASPLYVACQNGHKEIVNMLLNRVEDINKCNRNGASPLYIACQNGYKEIVRMLLEKKADINKCADAGGSPLFISCQNGHTEIINMLLGNNPYIDQCMDGARGATYYI